MVLPLLSALLGAGLTARASPEATPDTDTPPADADEPGAEAGEPSVGKTWGGVVIPLIGANPIDGLGFGVGGEIFRRPADQEAGYDLKFTPSIYLNTRLDYTNDFLRIEWEGNDRWLMMVGYQQWANLSYAGAGGASVLIDHGDDEIGNAIWTPYVFLGVNRPIPGSSWTAFGQGYVRAARVRANPGGMLDRARPFGANGGLYTDLSLGVEHRAHDRWPMPHRGHVLESSLRIGATATTAGVRPIGGLLIEGMAWQSLGTDRLVAGGRIVFDKSTGRQPFFEQDKAAGRWRDELGSDQALAGYGRTRTRGDGLFAALAELRPTLFRARRGWFDLAAHLSLTAEIGWLYDHWDPGPPLPTVGIGVPLLWQQAVQVRPFVAWGWRADQAGAPRRPGLQFGVSVLDAL